MAKNMESYSVSDCDKMLECKCCADAYKKGKADMINEFVKAIEKHQTRQNSYLDPPYVEMGLDMTDVLEVTEQLRGEINENSKGCKNIYTRNWLLGR